MMFAKRRAVKRVLCEKPMCVDAGEVEQLVKAGNFHASKPSCPLYSPVMAVTFPLSHIAACSTMKNHASRLTLAV